MNSHRSEKIGVWSKLITNKHFVRILLIIILIGIYISAIPLLDRTFGLAGRGFSLTYILLAAWFWGLWGGLLANLVNIPLNLAVSRLSGVELLPMWPIGNLFLVSAGVFVGLLRDLSLRLQEQLREKEQAEKRLEAYRDQLEEMVEKRTTDLSEANRELKNSFSEIKRLRDQLQAENIYLREEIALTYKHEGIIGESDAIKQVLAKIEQVAETESTVLVLGETGTGKELVTRAIHKLSSRKDRPMVKINCASLPPTLIENELFGREKGAYTGAISKQTGRFEIADNSTIFLDEIGELPMDLQTKLLRVLQEGQFERLGGSKTITVDVRVIAATNRDLNKAVREGKFREDLFYRLNVFPIFIPPLRDRTEDIPALAWLFIKEFGKTMGKRVETIPKKSMEALERYPWPGNIRELRNVIEQAMIISKDKTLNVIMPGLANSEKLQGLTLESVERSHILGILERTKWRVSGKNGAAEMLGLKPTTLEYRMKKLGIKRSV